MIKTISSQELKTDVDLICTYCGRNNYERLPNGTFAREEGKDYVFERDGEDEYCICLSCQKECDEKGYK